MAYDPTYPADDIYVKDLPAAIRQKGEDIRGATDATPVGVVLPFAGNVAPGGYLLCDGQAVSRETYSTLFSVIGITFGSGNGSTTFNVPDLRGEFIRGLDGGRGVDSGRVLGSAQGSANLSHTHTGTTASGGPTSTGSAGLHRHTVPTRPGSGSNQFEVSSDYGGNDIYGRDTSETGNHSHSISPHSHTMSLNNSGGTEARPRNIALNHIIKA